MPEVLLALITLGVIAIVAVTEIAAAALPMLIIILLVPPGERECLARLLAATDSSHRLRLWPALRAAVTARRMARKPAEPPHNANRP
jgi:hypothetical protein